MSLPRASAALPVLASLAAVALLAAGCGGGSKAVAPAASLRLENEYLRFARCMRSHEVSDFPDPVTGRGGHPGFRLQGGSNGDLSADNPAFQRGVEACQHVLGHQFRFAFASSGVGKGA
jgi:hypothetical protein